MAARHPCLESRVCCLYRLALITLIALTVPACSVKVARDTPAGTSGNAGVVPRAEPLSRTGNPESYVVFGKTYYPMKVSNGFTQQGVASWYGKKFHGRKTSSGEIYDMYQMTAAHKRLPLPTYVSVKNLQNGRQTIVRVNDRGPFHDNRIIDLSYAAALKLGIVENGTALVEVTALEPGTKGAVPPPPVRTARADLFLQIGAFNERSNAERLSSRVARHVSKNVRIRQDNINNKPVYRVQVGPIFDVELADQLVAVLSNLGISEHHFVSN